MKDQFWRRSQALVGEGVISLSEGSEPIRDSDSSKDLEKGKRKVHEGSPHSVLCLIRLDRA